MCKNTWTKKIVRQFEVTDSSSMSEYSLQSSAIVAGKFLKLVGYGTFSLIDNKIQVTVFDFACLTFNVCIGCLVFYLSLWYGAERLSKGSVLLSLGIMITMNGGSFSTLTSMICVFYNRHNIWKVIVMFDDVTAKFRRIHVKPDFKQYMILFAIFAIISTLLIIIGLLVMAFWLGYSSRIFILLIYGYLSASFATSMGWTAMFHLAIYLRLRLLNQTIRWALGINN